MSLAVAGLLAGGCANPTGCTEQVQSTDAIWTDGAGFDLAMARVTAWRAEGYTCTDAAILNTVGVRVGTRYTCTRCR